MFKKLVVVLVGVYALVLGVLYFVQDQLLLHPDKSPFELSASNPQVRVGDWVVAGQYRGMLAEPRQPLLKGTVVFFHGNAGQAAHRLFIAESIAALGYRVLVAEYPGFGRRVGDATVRQVLDAANTDFELAYAQWREPIYVMGESFGAGVAAQVVRRHSTQVAALALFMPWDSLTALAQTQFPIVPAAWLLHDQMDSVQALAQFKRPITLLVAQQDTIIAPEHGRALARALPGSRLIERPATHNGLLPSLTALDWEMVMSGLQ